MSAVEPQRDWQDPLSLEMPTYAARVFQFRRKHNLTQSQLGAHLGLHVVNRQCRAVTRWEGGGGVEPYLWRALRDLERELPAPIADQSDMNTGAKP